MYNRLIYHGFHSCLYVMINEFMFYMLIKNISQVFTFFLLPDAQFTNYLITLNNFEKLTNFLFASFLTRRILVIVISIGIFVSTQIDNLDGGINWIRIVNNLVPDGF